MSPPAQQRAEQMLSYVRLSQFVAPLLRGAWTVQRAVPTTFGKLDRYKCELFRVFRGFRG
jgi:hypothetical protein